MISEWIELIYSFKFAYSRSETAGDPLSDILILLTNALNEISLDFFNNNSKF